MKKYKHLANSVGTKYKENGLHVRQEDIHVINYKTARGTISLRHLNLPRAHGNLSCAHKKVLRANGIVSGVYQIVFCAHKKEKSST